MNCSICQHPQQADIIIDYAYTKSFRLTALRYRIGYRSLQRHVSRCIYALLEEQEQNEYELEFSRVVNLLAFYCNPSPKPYRLKSIITKPVEFTWSRRAWKARKESL